MNNEYLKPALYLLLIAGLTYITAQYFRLQAQSLKNEAISSCLLASGTFEFTDTQKGVKTTAPQKEFYKVCMADKGYSTSWN